MALAGAFLWGKAALLPSCYFVSRTVDYTNHGLMSVIEIFRQLPHDFLFADHPSRIVAPATTCWAGYN
jgi:hypothetical protein